ncbi:MAG: hypothetical protein JO323_22240 [Acidobacteriia bacterium]|nr:hypothetical protein [Terriglobia bacterium]
MDRYLGQQSESVCHAVDQRLVDDATARYMAESRRHFDDLRQVSAQLAGLLVLAAAGSRSAGPHHPIVESAAQLYGEALDGIRQMRLTRRSRKHHQHLIEAAEALGQALAAARSGLAIDPVLVPLRAAYAQLELASRELPGFQMVAFDQACCRRNE